MSDTEEKVPNYGKWDWTQEHELSSHYIFNKASDDDYKRVMWGAKALTALAGCPDPEAFVKAARNTISKLARDGIVPGIDQTADFSWLREESK